MLALVMLCALELNRPEYGFWLCHLAKFVILAEKTLNLFLLQFFHM